MFYFAYERLLEYDPIYGELHVDVLAHTKYSTKKKIKLEQEISNDLIPSLRKIVPIEIAQKLLPETFLDEEIKLHHYQWIITKSVKRRKNNTFEITSPFLLNIYWNKQNLTTITKFRLEVLTPQQFEDSIDFINKYLNKIYGHYGMFYYDKIEEIRRDVEVGFNQRQKIIDRGIVAAKLRYPRNYLAAREILTKSLQK